MKETKKNKTVAQFDLEIYIATQMEMVELEAAKEKDKQTFDDDPLMRFGTGILGFREITKAFVLLYIILTLFSLPIIIIYTKGDSI